MTEKLFNSQFNSFFYVNLHFHVFLKTVQLIHNYKFKSSVEVNPIDENPIEVYPKEVVCLSTVTL